MHDISERKVRMVKNRRANAVLFGLIFKEMPLLFLCWKESRNCVLCVLRYEEDIELILENGKKFLPKAKAVEKSSSDFLMCVKI